MLPVNIICCNAEIAKRPRSYACIKPAGALTCSGEINSSGNSFFALAKTAR